MSSQWRPSSSRARTCCSCASKRILVQRGDVGLDGAIEDAPDEFIRIGGKLALKESGNLGGTVTGAGPLH